jgi:ATP-dependent RNA helicase DeaD
MGFYEDMKRIFRYLPSQLCSTLFSATISESIKSLSREFQSHTRQFLAIKNKDEDTNTLDHFYTVVDPLEKDQAILKIIEFENPESSILFCNMKKDVQYIYDFLSSRGFSVGTLSGDVNQAQRQKTLTQFRDKKIKVLIATDVAARGIDISHVTHVILHDHPDDNEVYVHRSGRTARAGRKGKAISVVSSVEELAIKKTSQLFKIDFEKIDLPTEEEIAKQIAQKIAIKLEEGNRNLKPIEKKLAVRMAPTLEQLMADENHKKALEQLLYDFYKKRVLN